MKITSVFFSRPLASSASRTSPTRAVDLLDHVAIEALPRLAPVPITDVERHVRHRVREVEEEGPILVAIDERHGALGVKAGQPGLVFGRDVGIDDLVPLDQGKGGIGAGLRLGVGRPHVVGVGETEVFVEPMVDRQEPGMMAEVPLAGHAGGISSRV